MKISVVMINRTLVFVLAPASALLIFSPIAIGVLGAAEFKFSYFLLSSPFYLGLMCMPGYIYTLYTQPSARRVMSIRVWWIRLSLFGAIVSSMIGVIGGSIMILFALPALIALITSFMLLRRFEQFERQVPKSVLELAQASLLLLPTLLVLVMFTSETFKWIQTFGSLSEMFGIAWLYLIWSLCIPGYFFAVFAAPIASQVSLSRRRWIRMSLLGTMLCSTMGAIDNGMKLLLNVPFLYSVPSVVAFITALYLFLDFEQAEIAVERSA